MSLALTRIQPIATGSQRCLNQDTRCAGISKQPMFQQEAGFGAGSSAQWVCQTPVATQLARPGGSRGLFAKLSVQPASPSKRKTMVTQDISRLAAIPATAKWHICTGRYSISPQSCSNCESQAQDFIPQLFQNQVLKAS